ncbi:uncharacterized protein TNCV_241591 [Trichonephila clavipes]|uniref:Uncharacterized protein n=1 Tax=Trichonephila clavipes TaxID=2585209 RepID=A0A8X7BDC2_TRICX|nr:uncharacterized protein TNCV_241591 [Trichonephila clavipes]
MQDLTPITPAMFLFEMPTADTKALDVRDANHFRKRLRFRAKRVFPLEVSGNDVTKQPLHKVQQTDSSVNYPNPDTLKATEKPQVTRCGHPMKKPDKLNLLTLNDVFD